MKEDEKMLSHNKIIKRLFGFCTIAAIATLSIGCSRLVILFKPSPYIDPMPKEVTEERVSVESVGKDPQFDNQWNLQMVGVEDINDTDFHGNYNIKVAILSTGIDYNHEDLRGQVVINRKEIQHKSIGEKPGVDRKDNDENGLVDDVAGVDVVHGDGFAYDRHGAGTAVAGIIAALPNNSKGLAGLMGKVSLFPIRYIDDNGQSSVGNLVAALGVAIKVKPHVIYIQNILLETGIEGSERAFMETQSIRGQLTELEKMKIPIVIGAGDSFASYGEKGLEKIFRGYTNIIVVNSITKALQKPFLSNHHARLVTTSAPGVHLPVLGLKNSYTTVSGTAYAAAHVTAAVALAISKFGQDSEQADPERIKRALYSNEGGDYVRDMLGLNRGNNKLNIKKFLARLKVQN